MAGTPLVDVAMAAYNHEKFIAQAIESVLAQQTDFAYRLIVGDDCSADDTQAIIRRYAEAHPDRVETILDSEHLGITHRDRVGVKLLRRSASKYVALIDGDDYWTDPHKLQKQVDFLESHPECTLCFHNAEVLYEDGSHPPNNLRPPGQKELSTLEDILAGLVPITCSVMFRNHVWGELPECFYQVRNPDLMMFVLLAERGDVGYIDEVMAAYRLHGGSGWSSFTKPRQIKELIRTYKMIDAHLNFKHHRLISGQIAAWRKTLSREYGQHARSCLNQYHDLARQGEIKISLLLEAARSAPLEVFRPRRFAAVLKNGLLGIFWKSNVPT